MKTIAWWRRSIPNFFTFANMFCGFLSVTSVAKGEYTLGAWLIIIAAISDALDGVMARLTKSSSQFGVELDSLADVISFGFAPAYLLYTIDLHRFDNPGMLIAAFFLICGGFRLARFNSELVSFKKEHFKGLPIPAAAITVASFILLTAKNNFYVPGDKYYAGMLSIVLSLLMVSHIKYDTLPKFTKAGIRQKPVMFSLTLIAAIVLFITGTQSLFFIFAAFVLLGILQQLFSTSKRLVSGISGKH